MNLTIQLFKSVYTNMIEKFEVIGTVGDLVLHSHDSDFFCAVKVCAEPPNKKWYFMSAQTLL